MKKLLCLFAFLALCCTAVAQNEIGYFTGAWYETKTPSTRFKQGGHHDVTFWDDGTVDGTIYYDGEDAYEFSGSWTIRKNVYYVTMTDAIGRTWKATLRYNAKVGNYSLKGTFRSPSGLVRGNWMGD